MELLTIKQASRWASAHTGRAVTPANISYLLQYGRIRKRHGNDGVQVDKNDLLAYYASRHGERAADWQKQLGDGLNWALSFDQYKEAETTKHVHRLHPYKGKFIPQLVEYFLDAHTDAFKKEAYFSPGDIILDPFSGSGTTMVQACELNMHCVGIDISAFNALIGNAKIARYDIRAVKTAIDGITTVLRASVVKSSVRHFDEAVSAALAQFNQRHFPSDYKARVRDKTIDETAYGEERARQFRATYDSLLHEYGIRLVQNKTDDFLDTWFSAPVREEIDLVFTHIRAINDPSTQKILRVMLSRVIRSCRATTHSDLGTLAQHPVHHSYYCAKHGKVCRPVLSIVKRWGMYSQDTLKRLAAFDCHRTDTFQICLTGDSRDIDIPRAIQTAHPAFHRLLCEQKIKGIFSSPPYVGLIDYHEQHAYAYDLFGWARRDGDEIGALRRGQSKAAQRAYVDGTSAVLTHCKRYLADDSHVFLVANDKYGLYPTIAANAGMQIIATFHRPVLNRTEKDKRAYSETIFHMRLK